MSNTRNLPQYGPQTDDSLQNLLMSLPIVTLKLEALLTGDHVADPDKAKLGKRKNHWVFRLLTDRPFGYVLGGVPKVCYSSLPDGRAEQRVTI
jgi:hypothetical protein